MRNLYGLGQFNWLNSSVNPPWKSGPSVPLERVERALKVMRSVPILCGSDKIKPLGLHVTSRNPPWKKDPSIPLERKEQAGRHQWTGIIKWCVPWHSGTIFCVFEFKRNLLSRMDGLPSGDPLLWKKFPVGSWSPPDWKPPSTGVPWGINLHVDQLVFFEFPTWKRESLCNPMCI